MFKQEILCLRRKSEQKPKMITKYQKKIFKFSFREIMQTMKKFEV